MKPILFNLLGYPVPTYGVMMAMGYVMALLTLLYVTPKTERTGDGGLNRPQVFDLFLVMLVSSILGAKLGHVFFEAPGHIGSDGQEIHNVYELLRDDPLHWAKLLDGGYVWYGGMLGALLTALFYFRKRPHLDAWLYSDAFAPAVMTGAVVGRLGCFLAGCCYGVATDLPWGVKFPDTPHPVHPTQLYDASAALVLGSVLLWRFGRRRFNGENIALLLMTYPILRSLTEAFRGDDDRGVYANALSTSQLISIPLFAVGAWIYWSRSHQAASVTSSTTEAPISEEGAPSDPESPGDSELDPA